MRCCAHTWNAPRHQCASIQRSEGSPNRPLQPTELPRTPATPPALISPLHAITPCCILNHMVQYSQVRFDVSFGALSDATRRGVLEQLGRADASITALAERFHMTLTGMRKHVGVLERAGLVTTEKVGRVRTCRLGVRGLEEEGA